MRARYPDHEGFVDRDGVDIHYDVYENDEPTVVLVPTSTIWHSRQWKAQIPYLARHFRVVVYDGRGNGRSAVPTEAIAYSEEENVGDLVAVIEETQTTGAVHIAYCHGTDWSIEVALRYPDLVRAVVATSPGVDQLAPPVGHYAWAEAHFEDDPAGRTGWQRLTRRFLLDNYEEWTNFFFSEMLPESHTTKIHEDSVEWALGRTAGTAVHSIEALIISPPANVDDVIARCSALSRPLLVIHGDLDRCQRMEKAERLAGPTGGELVILEGVGHVPQAREPVKVNLLIKDFVERVAA